MAAACIPHSSTAEAKPSTQCQPRSLPCRYIIFCRPISSNLTFCKPVDKEEEDDDLWFRIRHEALSDLEQEPVLLNYYNSLILSHNSLETALSNLLATKLSNSSLPAEKLYQIFSTLIQDDFEIKRSIRRDLEAARYRDPACTSYIHCFLNFKGFQAIQSYRVAHKLRSEGKLSIAGLIRERASEVFAVDIHPRAKIGGGILVDHGTGIVIGETVVIGDNVTIMHNVTMLGNVECGDWVILGAGAKVLGNIRVGERAKIGAGSLVLQEVPSNCTAVGNPARIISGKGKGTLHK